MVSVPRRREVHGLGGVAVVGHAVVVEEVGRLARLAPGLQVAEAWWLERAADGVDELKVVRRAYLADASGDHVGARVL